MAGRAFGFDRGFAEFHEVFATHGSEASAMRSVLPGWWSAAGAGRFFAYVHYREPHFPFDPQQPFLDRLGADVGPIAKPLRSDMSWITSVNRGERSLSEEEERQLRLLYEANLAQVGRCARRAGRGSRERGSSRADTPHHHIGPR